MCGICGVVSRSPLGGEEIEKVKEMNAALFHRGPNSSGFFNGGNAAFAMRRLSIIDLSGGDQPLYNENKELALVANGEIYNHIELRAELEKKGHVFKTKSDCETIVHLYEDQQENMLNSLRGMYAFAIYDKARRKVIIARDRLSEKPLYYTLKKDKLIFSSEMKSLISYMRQDGIELNLDGVNMYLHYQYIPEPYTCIKGIWKLPAAHYMSISLQHNDFSVNTVKYWDFEDVKPVSGNPAEMIREELETISRLIIRSDVPVGIALSGGIDSGVIASLAAKHYKEQMYAFSIGYSGRPPCDERSMAEGLAKKLGLKFFDVELSADEFVDFFPNLVHWMDDPIADIAGYGYYAVSKLAREHGVPVLLSGIGGDELFWGYGWMVQSVKNNLAKQNVLKNGFIDKSRWLFDIAKGEYRRNGISPKIFNIINRIGIRNKAHKEANQYVYLDETNDFMLAFDFIYQYGTPEYLSSIDRNLLFSFFADNKDGEKENIPIKLCKFLYQTWLYSNCIALSDRMSMASSIELRLPLLDYKLVELVMGLRKHTEDYNFGYKKWFIEAVTNIMPNEILTRKKKGFTPPVVEWQRKLLKKYGNLCVDGYLSSTGVINPDKIIKIMEIAQKTNIENAQHLFFLYKLILLEFWCRYLIKGENQFNLRPL